MTIIHVHNPDTGRERTYQVDDSFALDIEREIETAPTEGAKE